MKEIKNHKGFTMVELLATVVILGILSVTAIVAVTKLVNRAKDTEEKSQKDNLIMAAKSYLEANRDKMPKEIGESRRVYAYELRDARFLKDKLKNKKGQDCTGSSSNKQSFVRIYKYSKTEYNYSAYMYCGSDTAPSSDPVEVPDISIKFLSEGQTQINNKIQNLSTARLSITIKGSNNNSSLGLDGYSFSIAVKTKGDSNEREVYNSGSIKANKKTEVIINKPLTDYIDVTDLTKITVKVVARNMDGGYYTVDKQTDAESSVAEFKDETPPVCGEITGAASNDSDWITEEGQERTITVACSDGEGSGCTRDTFTKTWPNDTEKTAEYSNITIEDNAGKTTDCPVRVNVDVVYPEVTVGAYKRSSNGQPDGNNLFKNAVSAGANAANSTKSVSADQYNNLVNNWMNQANYGTGVVYKAVISDQPKLASWKWETNASGITNTSATNYKQINANSGEKASGNLSDSSHEIQFGFTGDGYRYGKLTVTDVVGHNTVIELYANIDKTKPTCSISKSGTSGDNSWYKAKDVTLTLSKSDATSGLQTGFGLTTSSSKSYNSTSTTGTQGNTNGVTWYGYVKDNAGNENSCNSGSFKVDKTNPTCTAYITKLDGTKISAGKLQHEEIYAKSNCSDSNSGCTKENPYETSSKISNTSSVSIKNNKVDSITQKQTKSFTVKDKAGNTSSCSTTAYTIPICTGVDKVYGNALMTNTPFYCTLDFKHNTPTGNTGFCLGWNSNSYKNTHGQLQYLAFCEGGEGGNCKAICEGTSCQNVTHSIDTAMANSIAAGPNASPAWNHQVNGTTYYFGRFDKYNGKSNPFTSRQINKKGSSYNICDLDYGENGGTVWTR